MWRIVVAIRNQFRKAMEIPSGAPLSPVLAVPFELAPPLYMYCLAASTTGRRI